MNQIDFHAGKAELRGFDDLNRFLCLPENALFESLDCFPEGKTRACKFHARKPVVYGRERQSPH